MTTTTTTTENALTFRVHSSKAQFALRSRRTSQADAVIWVYILFSNLDRTRQSPYVHPRIANETNQLNPIGIE